MATLLQNIQDVCAEIGLPIPNNVAGSTDAQVQQLQALLNRSGKTIATERDWQILASEYRFETVYYTYTADLSTSSTTMPVRPGTISSTLATTVLPLVACTSTWAAGARPVGGLLLGL